MAKSNSFNKREVEKNKHQKRKEKQQKRAPSKSNNFLSTAKSISSENRSITFQTLLNEVPPLKTNLSTKGNEKISCKKVVTHKSFSIICGYKSFIFALVCSMTSLRCSFVRLKKLFTKFDY